MGPTLEKTSRELHPGVSGDSVGMSRIVATFIGHAYPVDSGNPYILCYGLVAVRPSGVGLRASSGGPMRLCRP